MKMLPLSDISFIGRQEGGIGTLESTFRKPATFFWKARSLEEFSREFEEALHVLRKSPFLSRFLEIHLFTGFFLFKRELPKWSEKWLRGRRSFETYFPELSFDQAASITWRITSGILINENETSARYFLTGLFSHRKNPVVWPEWADFLMTESFRGSIRNAADAVFKNEGSTSGMGFYCFPLTAPNGRSQFDGASMGLPFALTFTSLLKETPVHPEIISTGTIRKNGRVGYVDRLDKKFAFCKKKFRVFLYPYENRLNEETDMNLLPVEDLREAWMLVELHTPGSAGKLGILLGMLRDPAFFLRNIDTIPPEWLSWCIRNGTADTIINKILASPEWFSVLIQRFQASIVEGRNEIALAVSRVLTPEKDIPELKKTAPLSLFRWASLNLLMWNHRGRVEKACFWEDVADDLLEKAEQSDLSAVADYFNFLFLLKHNRYEFHPDLPDHLKKVLRILESQYRVQCEFGCPVNQVLGRLYGTIAQNYAFLGPDFLPQTIEYSEKARKTLGENTVPEYRENWLRQYNYLTYALLDAGESHFNEARSSLLRYLELDNLNEINRFLDCFSQWKHALLARFIAETTPRVMEDCFRKWDRSENPFSRNEHPWQLWSFNMGRIAMTLGKKKKAGKWFRRSLKICLDTELGSSIRVMALLPLSKLVEMDDLDAIDLKETELRVKTAAQKLNPDFFRIFLENKFEDSFAMVRRHPEKWFPFNYR